MSLSSLPPAIIQTNQGPAQEEKVAEQKYIPKFIKQFPKQKKSKRNVDNL
jgi:hypothetical protein